MTKVIGVRFRTAGEKSTIFHRESLRSNRETT